MRPRLRVRGTTKPKGWENALRFLFGGLVTVGLGIVSRRWGPAIGGLLLGFPAIFPASITLVNEDEGRAKAIDDARGARLGSIAMIVFAVVVHETASSWRPPTVLAIATLAWLTAALVLWMVVYGWRRE